MFDYIYYRLTKFFYKSDGEFAARAVIILSVGQGLVIGGIITMIARLFLTRDEIYDLEIGGREGVVVYFILCLSNHLYYRNRYKLFDERWGNSETIQQKKIRGLLVLLAVLSPFLLLYLVTSY